MFTDILLWNRVPTAGSWPELLAMDDWEIQQYGDILTKLLSVLTQTVFDHTISKQSNVWRTPTSLKKVIP